ncbi:MAG: creatininase family protein [Balneolaceae bacterium]|nr:creatininase family protein [Balneolaceae bacterium]MCH8548911.1 creatininase family protein [Balneolaceae bacterium]
MRPYNLSDSSWKEIETQEIDLVILPWGATEAHNYHLPYGTDNIQADHIADEAARKAWENGAKVMVLPTIPFGVNTGQTDIRLDINLHPSTQLKILDDIVEVLNSQTFRKLLVLNGHGGNDFKTMLRELGVKYPEMLLTTCNWFQALDKSNYFEHEGDHADEMETSLMLYIAGELVHPLKVAGDGREREPKVKAFKESWAWSERKWSQVTDDTGIGDPSASSAEKGERFFNDLTDKLAGFFSELSSVDPDNLYT